MKLELLLVPDLSRFLPGSILTQFMSDHGAEVTKMESVAEGEPTRAAWLAFLAVLDVPLSPVRPCLKFSKLSISGAAAW